MELFFFNLALSAQNIPIIPEQDHYFQSGGFLTVGSKLQIENSFNNEKVLEYLKNFDTYFVANTKTHSQKNEGSTRIMVSKNTIIETKE